MEVAVDLGEVCPVLAIDRTTRTRKGSPQSLDPGCIEPGRREFRCPSLQDFPDSVNLVRLRCRDLPDCHSAVGRLLHEPFTRESLQRITHGTLADAEPLA